MKAAGILTMNDELTKIWECLSTIEKAIVGDMKDAKNPGLLVRIDRLEQSKRLKDKVLWFLSTTIIYLVAQQVI